MISINIAESKNCNGQYSMYITSEYIGKLVSAIQTIEDRYWDKRNKVWEVPAKNLSFIVNTVSDYEIKISGLMNIFDTSVEKHMSTNFSFKTTPFQHQIDGFMFGQAHDRWLLADEQGLGKTKQVIDIAVHKKQLGEINRCFIICGVNGLKWNWCREVETHSNETAYILGEKLNNKNETVIGSTADKLRDLKQLDDIDSFFIITNVESLRDSEIATTLASVCKNEMVAIDEIHKCKNPQSQQGKGILTVKSKYRIAMTGTPIMNNPMDLFVILKWLGYENHSFYAFKNHYCVMGGYGGYEVIGYKNMDKLDAQLKDIMLRRKKNDVLDLPEKMYIDEFVDMTPKQIQIYKEVQTAILSNIDAIALSANPLAQLIRLRQATGFTGILSNTIQESAKMDRLEELVDEIVLNDNKVVIFSNWTQMTDIIWTRLSKKYKGTIITGNTADEERQANVIAFQTNPECKFILGTIGAIGTGLTLTAGSTVIFMDEPWTMANKQQAIDRCHRIGTKSTVTVYTLMCKNTIDERIHDIVEKKGAISDALIDGKLTGNKTELLNFLLS